MDTARLVDRCAVQCQGLGVQLTRVPLLMHDVSGSAYFDAVVVSRRPPRIQPSIVRY